MNIYETPRQLRRKTAAYWLRSARTSFKHAKQFDKPGDNMFLDLALKDMRRYARWKADAERGEG